MKRTFGVLFTAMLMIIITGNLFAQEMMMMKQMDGEKEEAGADAKKMGGMGMMSGGMMCPMHGNMMGNQGMMGGGMMPMMQGMMGGNQSMMSGGMMPMMHGMMGGMGMMDMKPYIDGMAEALDLSEEQQANLKALHIAYKKDMIRKRADKEITEIDLQELIQQDEPDLDTIKGQIRKVTNLESDMKYAWIKLMVDAKSLLNTNQREKFKKLMMDREKSMMNCQMMGEKKSEASMPGTGGRSEHHK